MNNYYKDAKSWNPYKGCRFNCVYCKTSFQRQAKRQKHNCIKCYNYEPHFHPERLNKIPKAELVTACGNGDIAFANDNEKTTIIDVMSWKPKQTFLLQTKDPSCLKGYIIPPNVIVGTTIETNRDTTKISKAPDTYKRYWHMRELKCRKAVTIEPILDFDVEVLSRWIEDIKPEIVWIGYANHSESFNFDEPELEKTKELIKRMEKFTKVKLKTMKNPKLL